jgi:hypothetical protein
VSADFLDSDYCHDVEMQQALRRHESGDARVIPVILRPCDWQQSLLGGLQALPTDGRPVTKFPDRDEAFLDVVQGVRKVLPPSRDAEDPASATAPPAHAAKKQSVARSSNLRVKRDFSDREQDAFLEETFEYMANYFENSLTELEGRNPAISGAFKRIDARQFTAVVYRQGNRVSQCAIILQMGHGGFGKGITYSSDSSSGGISEQLTVKTDGYALYLNALMGHTFQQSDQRHLTQEGASELLWSRLIETLQQ